MTKNAAAATRYFNIMLAQGYDEQQCYTRCAYLHNVEGMSTDVRDALMALIFDHFND